MFLWCDVCGSPFMYECRVLVDSWWFVMCSVVRLWLWLSALCVFIDVLFGSVFDV